MGQGKNLAAEAMMVRIDDLVSARGEDATTMAEVGELLRELACDPDFSFDVGEEPSFREGIVVAQILARGANGERLTKNDFKAPWPAEATEHASVHWHNYWQTLLLVRGNWEDTIWEPIDDGKEVGPESVRIARHEVLHPGDVQILGPRIPHGWEVGEARNADDALLLFWTGSSGGKPFTAIDLATGALSDASPQAS